MRLIFPWILLRNIKHPIPFIRSPLPTSPVSDLGEPNMCVTGTGLQYSTGTLYSEPFFVMSVNWPCSHSLSLNSEN